MSQTKQEYKRVLLKLSGEAFCRPGSFGVEPEELRVIASEIISAASTGVQIAVVVGGGNIIRGGQLAQDKLIHRATADYMGMLGTVINGLALKEALTSMGQDARCLTAVDIPSVAESFIRLRALRHFDKGRVVVLAGGTGNPFFTTDSCAALRATELECDIVLKATKVDGVYTADPNKDPSATRYDALTHSEALERRLGVMDSTAMAMCQDNNIPILVFKFKESGNIRRVVEGEQLGTLIHAG